MDKAEYTFTFDPQLSGHYKKEPQFDLIIVRDHRNYPWAAFHQDMLWKNKEEDGRDFFLRLHNGEKLICKVEITVLEEK